MALPTKSKSKGSRTAQSPKASRAHHEHSGNAKTLRNRKKREKRKARIQSMKEETRKASARARAQGLEPPKPCHLCHKKGHWSQDCEKYGAWKAMMDKKKKA